jgi:hypothetical protein
VPDGIENATHNTLQQKAGQRSGKCPGFSPDELRVAFSIPSDSLFLVNHPVFTLEELKLLNFICYNAKKKSNPKYILQSIHCDLVFKN